MAEMELLMRQFAIIRRIADLAPDPRKTTVQKIVYFLQSGVEIPLGYRFKMHYYGPYSEKLDDNLSLANAMGIVKVRPDSAGYGYHVRPGQYDVEIESSMSWGEIDQTIHILGGLELSRLELLATVHFVSRLRPQLPESKIVNTVRRLKPKFSKKTIEGAYSDIIQMGFVKSGS